MSAAAALSVQATACPAWCTDTDGAYGLHLGEVREVGDLVLCLSQDPGQAAPTIGLNDDQDHEMTLTLAEAERFGTMLLQLSEDLTFALEEAEPLGTLLLQLARQGREAGRLAA
jgi:hypothetical protein